jgi:hypothetical protein
MSTLRFNITMSMDGFVAGPDQSEENPLGVGGEELHKWLAARTYRSAAAQTSHSSTSLRG